MIGSMSIWQLIQAAIICCLVVMAVSLLFEGLFAAIEWMWKKMRQWWITRSVKASIAAAQGDCAPRQELYANVEGHQTQDAHSAVATGEYKVVENDEDRKREQIAAQLKNARQKTAYMESQGYVFKVWHGAGWWYDGLIPEVEQSMILYMPMEKVKERYNKRRRELNRQKEY